MPPHAAGAAVWGGAGGGRAQHACTHPAGPHRAQGPTRPPRLPPTPQVDDAFVASDRETGRSRGFGFVTMDTAGGNEAIANLNETEFMGRTIRVNEAQPQGERPGARAQRPPAARGGGGRAPAVRACAPSSAQLQSGQCLWYQYSKRMLAAPTWHCRARRCCLGALAALHSLI